MLLAAAALGDHRLPSRAFLLASRPRLVAPSLARGFVLSSRLHHERRFGRECLPHAGQRGGRRPPRPRRRHLGRDGAQRHRRGPGGRRCRRTGPRLPEHATAPQDERDEGGQQHQQEDTPRAQATRRCGASLCSSVCCLSRVDGRRSGPDEERLRRSHPRGQGGRVEVPRQAAQHHQVLATIQAFHSRVRHQEGEGREEGGQTQARARSHTKDSPSNPAHATREVCNVAARQAWAEVSTAADAVRCFFCSSHLRPPLSACRAKSIVSVR